jgi:AcrR family transcriptional regulator
MTLSGCRWTVVTSPGTSRYKAPFESSGREEQKSRTREALVTATRRLLADGRDPTVDDVAAAAGISRATAFRYFPSRRALVATAHPQIDEVSLLPDDAPDEPHARLDLTMDALLRITLGWEPQLRASLRVSLEAGAELPLLRQGRAIGWIEDALEPLRRTHPRLDRRRLAVAIRSATGIEALVWLTDVGGLSRDEAAGVLRWSAHAQLAAAPAGDAPPGGRRRAEQPA